MHIVVYFSILAKIWVFFILSKYWPNLGFFFVLAKFWIFFPFSENLDFGLFFQQDDKISGFCTPEVITSNPCDFCCFGFSLKTLPVS
jgi:hypothetical protein